MHDAGMIFLIAASLAAAQTLGADPTAIVRKFLNKAIAGDASIFVGLTWCRNRHEQYCDTNEPRDIFDLGAGLPGGRRDRDCRPVPRSGSSGCEGGSPLFGERQELRSADSFYGRRYGNHRRVHARLAVTGQVKV